MNDSQAVESDSQETRRLRALNAINQRLQQIVSEGLNIDVVLPEVLQIAMAELEAFGGSIVVVNEDFEVQHGWLISGWQEESQVDFLGLAIKGGLAGWVVRNQQATIIANTQEDERWLPGPGYESSNQPWSAICVPLIVRHRSVGAISMTRPGRGQFTGDDLELLGAMADQAAITIESARLYELSVQRANDLAALVESTASLSATLDPEQLLQETGKHMATLAQADACAIFEWLPESQIFQCRDLQVAEGIAYDEQHMRQAIRPGSYQFVGRLIQEQATAQFHLGQSPACNELHQYMSSAGIQSMLMVPMVFRGVVLGIAGIAFLRAPKQLDSTQIQLVQTFANHAAIALQNARQFERLQAAEARYLSLFEESINPLFLTDLAGNVVEANQRAFHELGDEPDALIGRPIAELHRATEGEPATNMALPTAEGDAVVSFQTALRRRDKESLPVEVHVKRTSFHGEPLLLWSYHDLSQQAALDEMRDDLTAMLVHDLQSPLANIISSLDLLRLELPADAETADTILDIASASSRHLQSLVHSILDINHLEAGRPLTDPSYFDLRGAVSEAVQTVSATLRQHRAELLIACEDNLPPAFGEQDMIRRVLVNLLDNCAKYSPAGAPISISIRRAPDSSRLLVSVSDQGAGVQPDHRLMIFHKFQRSRANGKQEAKGLGLGLAFCRMAIEAHGGAIWVDDAPGGGARFNFTLATSPF